MLCPDEIKRGAQLYELDQNVDHEGRYRTVRIPSIRHFRRYAVKRRTRCLIIWLNPQGLVMRDSPQVISSTGDATLDFDVFCGFGHGYFLRLWVGASKLLPISNVSSLLVHIVA
jgi:hypothetical protein